MYEIDFSDKSWMRKYEAHNFFRWFVEWDFVKEGRDSGFPWCCIVYYKVRLFFMAIWIITFNSYGPFNISIGDDKVFRSKKEMDAYFDTSEWKRQAQHITCWFHKILYALQRKEHTYYDCRECGWKQFEKKDCNRCN